MKKTFKCCVVMVLLGVVGSFSVEAGITDKLRKATKDAIGGGDSVGGGGMYNKGKNVVVECNSPKYPKERISMSYERFNKSKYVVKLIVGESKKKALNLIADEKILPVSRVFGDIEKNYICMHKYIKLV